MTNWEIWSWLSLLILGPGALVIFIFFLRDGRKLLRDMKKQNVGR